MNPTDGDVSEPDAAATGAARTQLDNHVVEMVQWHFHESTGSPFWLAKKAELKFDPLTEVRCFDDLKKFPSDPANFYKGKTVVATGKIAKEKKYTRIIVTDPENLFVVE